MIDELRLTIPGEELRRRLEERIAAHRHRAEDWKHEQARTPEEQTEESPLLPEQMCENEAERHEWRADVLEFIREHVEGGEIYRLSEADLAFAEVLPATPWSVEQDEWEERRASVSISSAWSRHSTDRGGRHRTSSSTRFASVVSRAVL